MKNANPNPPQPTPQTNNPEWFRGSTVVDSTGSPLEVFHCNDDLWTHEVVPSVPEAGLWFTESPERQPPNATMEGQHLYGAHLHMTNPLVIVRTHSDDEGMAQAIAMAKLSGHDGLVIRETELDDFIWPTNHVVFNRDQIRLVSINGFPIGAEDDPIPESSSLSSSRTRLGL
jgi:hypothetical protein